ncbi:hypothetical protein GCM10022221_71450 [Actinocorallia aurea]
MHRYRNLIGELARFGGVGVICVGINYLLFNLLSISYGWGALTANSLAMVVSTTVGFLASRYWTFRHIRTESAAREYTLFFVMNGVGYVITQAVLALAAHLTLEGKLWSNIALTVGIGLATVFRYFGYKRWVFVGADGGTAEVDSVGGGAVAGAATVTAPDLPLPIFSDGRIENVTPQMRPSGTPSAWPAPPSARGLRPAEVSRPAHGGRARGARPSAPTRRP